MCLDVTFSRILVIKLCAENHLTFLPECNGLSELSKMKKYHRTLLFDV